MQFKCYPEKRQLSIVFKISEKAGQVQLRMSGIARARLSEELKRWKKEHPVGFYANPKTNTDGTTNMLLWEFGIPGKVGTPYEGALERRPHREADSAQCP